MDRTYVEQNDRERERLRALIARSSDEELGRSVNESWTVAGVLGHVAFWDARAAWLAGKIERGEPFGASGAEPDPPDWLNDTKPPFLHAIAPRAAAEPALRFVECSANAVGAHVP